MDISSSGCIAVSEDEIVQCREQGIEVIDCGACISVRHQRSGTKLSCYLRGGYTLTTGAVKTAANLEKEGQIKGQDFQLCGAC